MKIAKACAAALLALAMQGAQAAATITIVNANAPGEGFNDPTPVAPVGGNTGATLGQQRLIAFAHAADIWAGTISSTVDIRVQASFVPLSCSANSAVLGSAGAADIFAEFPNAPRANTWYPGALAGKLALTDLVAPGAPHIIARFNARLGLAADCLPGSGFYLGLDNNHGAQIDLVTVLLHELAHGLGFQTFTDGQSGAYIDGRPSVWDHYLLDDRNGKHWTEMSAGERASSAVSGALSWDGPRVTAAVPAVLAPRSTLAISGPAAGDAAGNYEVGDASFGPPLSNPPVAADLMPVVDRADGTGLACAALDSVNTQAVRGHVALVDRGTCTFVQKAQNVQAAGAIGMVVADNQPGPVTGLGGTDPSIAIPAVRISQADGQTLKARLTHRSRTASGVIASLGVDNTRLAGADAALRILMYAPSPFQGGSSVSHYTTDARPNQLMEPSINGDLTHAVTVPRDLTYELLKDIGW